MFLREKEGFDFIVNTYISWIIIMKTWKHNRLIMRNVFHYFYIPRIYWMHCKYNFKVHYFLQPHFSKQSTCCIFISCCDTRAEKINIMFRWPTISLNKFDHSSLNPALSYGLPVPSWHSYLYSNDHALLGSIVIVWQWTRHGCCRWVKVKCIVDQISKDNHVDPCCIYRGHQKQQTSPNDWHAKASQLTIIHKPVKFIDELYGLPHINQQIAINRLLIIFGV